MNFSQFPRHFLFRKAKNFDPLKSLVGGWGAFGKEEGFHKEAYLGDSPTPGALRVLSVHELKTVQVFNFGHY